MSIRDDILAGLRAAEPGSIGDETPEELLDAYRAEVLAEAAPLVVRRVDCVVEPARFDGETETLVGCVAEDGRPVALLLDDDARGRLARNLSLEGGAR